jgi:hypothetical protein
MSPVVLGRDRPLNSTGNMLMKRTLVRYKAKPEMAHENERLIVGNYRMLVESRENA